MRAALSVCATRHRVPCVLRKLHSEGGVRAADVDGWHARLLGTLAHVFAAREESAQGSPAGKNSAQAPRCGAAVPPVPQVSVVGRLPTHADRSGVKVRPLRGPHGCTSRPRTRARAAPSGVARGLGLRTCVSLAPATHGRTEAKRAGYGNPAGVVCGRAVCGVCNRRLAASEFAASLLIPGGTWRGVGWRVWWPQQGRARYTW